MKKLGKNQRDMLAALRHHKGWSRNCGWHYGGHYATERLCESLVKLGLVTVTLTDAGRKRYAAKD
jgi:hypothetical protein